MNNMTPTTEMLLMNHITASTEMTTEMMMILMMITMSLEQPMVNRTIIP
jgi:hypothetical protein